jgi:hypothetical protein
MRKRIVSLGAATALALTGLIGVAATPANALGYTNCHTHDDYSNFPKVKSTVYCDFQTSLYTQRHLKIRVYYWTFGQTRA